MTIGERIKKLRIKNGLTQEDLAKKMGYAGKSIICKYETLSTDNMTLDIAQKFANALGTYPAYILWGEEIEWDPNSQEIYSEDDSYYQNKEAGAYADFLHKNPEYKVLFDASQKVKKEDLQKALKAIGLFIEED